MSVGFNSGFNQPNSISGFTSDRASILQRSAQPALGVDTIQFSARQGSGAKPSEFFPELSLSRVRRIKHQLSALINFKKKLVLTKLNEKQLNQLKPADVLVVLAHPDDELMMLGTLNKLSSQGYRVQMVYASSGCQGVDRTNRGLRGSALAEVREDEQVKALNRVGVNVPPVFLNLPDSQISQKNAEMAEALKVLLEKSDPSIVLTFGKDGLTGHEDHVVIGDLVRKAVLKADVDNALPVYHLSHSKEADAAFEKTVGRPDSWEGLTAVSNDDVIVKVPMDRDIRTHKTDAMACHQTQFTPETISDFERFFEAYPFETFTKA